MRINARLDDSYEDKFLRIRQSNRVMAFNLYF